jgi:hypothetical protein
MVERSSPLTTPAVPRASDLVPFVRRLLGPRAELSDLQIDFLTGGLIAEFVLQLRVRYSDAQGAPRSRRLVVKRLNAATAREAKIYEALAATPARDFMPGLLGVESSSRDELRLYLESVEASSAWPWRRVEDAGRVLDHLATLHERHACVLHDLVSDWDYERDLEEQAASTLSLLERTHAADRDRMMRVSLPAARRLVRELRCWRRELVESGPLPSSVIHGDLHPGNVLIRVGDEAPVLLDWARARVGSPLEDVSSWLQWLGFWEPAVKRKHDTLLARYLVARGFPRFSSGSLRAAYWLAGASNCLAGALRYHLVILGDAQQGEARRAAARLAAHDCLRVLRRADAYQHGSQSSRRTSNATSRGA